MESHRVVAAILRRGDEVLLCHRSPSRRWYPNVWDFPGGHVEPGEVPEHALRRELLEEIGINVTQFAPEPVLRLTDKEGDIELTVWLVTDWQGAVENRQPDEHDSLAWFRAEELAPLDLADPSYMPLLQNVLDNR